MEVMEMTLFLVLLLQQPVAVVAATTVAVLETLVVRVAVGLVMGVLLQIVD
jgi:hypothetical protein